MIFCLTENEREGSRDLQGRRGYTIALIVLMNRSFESGLFASNVNLEFSRLSNVASISSNCFDSDLLECLLNWPRVSRGGSTTNDHCDECRRGSFDGISHGVFSAF